MRLCRIVKRSRIVKLFRIVGAGAVLAVIGCASSSRDQADPAFSDLVGAWRSHVQFTSGAFAEIKDLEFMFVFNMGGTMTESSNYDGAPPVPPAYGTWTRVGPRQFVARYEFYSTKSPADVAELAKGGGWSPAGHGVFEEKITLAEDGNGFTSKIRYDAFDAAGAPAPGGGEADGKGTRFGGRPEGGD